MKPLQTIYTNSDYPLTLYYKDVDGNAIDITGATAQLMVRRSLYSDPVITKAAVIDGPTGSILFPIAAIDTQSILGESDSEKFLIGAVLTLADGEVITLFQTSVDITHNVVR